MMVHHAPVRFLGLHPFRAIPVAILTSRGTIRTRKQPGIGVNGISPAGLLCGLNGASLRSAFTASRAAADTMPRLSLSISRRTERGPTLVSV